MEESLEGVVERVRDLGIVALTLERFTSVNSTLGTRWDNRTYASVLDRTQKESKVRRGPDLALCERPKEILDAVSGLCMDAFKMLTFILLVAPAGVNRATERDKWIVSGGV